VRLLRVAGLENVTGVPSMGRNRKPKAVAERDGSFEAHPERKAAYENEPKPEGPLGAPPKAFTDGSYTGDRLLVIWNELTSQAPPGVLTSADRMHVEMVCRLIYRVRHGSPKSGDFNSIKEFLGKMAMNPADRTKVQVNAGGGAPAPTPDGPDKDNPFAQLVDEERRTARPN
jgi:hypothetical protein